MEFYHWEGTNLYLSVHIQPHAQKDAIAGVFGDRLKIRITAPPADGQANAYLLKLLAKHFDVPKTQITLLSGHTSRDKRLCIKNPKKLLPLIQPAEEKTA